MVRVSWVLKWKIFSAINDFFFKKSNVFLTLHSRSAQRTVVIAPHSDEMLKSPQRVWREKKIDLVDKREEYDRLKRESKFSMRAIG